MARSDLIVDDPRELGVDAAALDSLYALVEKGVGRHKGCAAQVAVARGGRVAGFRAFGSARFSGEIKAADRESLFSVFSVTKAFVSSACWMLLHEGALSLGDRVVDYVPEFGRHGKEAVTVEHLLTHTAGFPRAASHHRSAFDLDSAQPFDHQVSDLRVDIHQREAGANLYLSDLPAGGSALSGDRPDDVAESILRFLGAPR